MDPIKVAGITEWPTPHQEEDTVISGLHKLLPEVHQELLKGPLMQLTRNVEWT